MKPLVTDTHIQSDPAIEGLLQLASASNLDPTLSPSTSTQLVVPWKLDWCNSSLRFQASEVIHHNITIPISSHYWNITSTCAAGPGAGDDHPHGPHTIYTSIPDPPPHHIEFEPAVAFANVSRQEFIKTYDYLIEPATPELQQLCANLRRLQEGLREEELVDSREPIAGEVVSYDMEKINAKLDSTRKELRSIRKKLKEVILNRFRSLNLIPPDSKKPYYVVTPKILIADSHVGAQAAHYDAPSWNETDKWSTIICLNDHEGIKSTAVPRYSKDKMKLGGSVTTPDQEEMRKVAYLFDPEWYYSVPFRLGDMIIFRQTLIHFGVRNNTRIPRMVHFCMVSPSKAKNQDAYQFYRWQFICLAYYSSDRNNLWIKCAEALMESCQHDPVYKYRLPRDRALALTSLTHYHKLKPSTSTYNEAVKYVQRKSLETAH